MRHRPTSGFTLIEISIVLVIIGLVVGGVLVGRDLIRGAQTRAVISNVDRYKAAVGAFRLKYNCIPGDCLNALTLFTTTYNGNNNNLVDNDTETFEFWRQLGYAQLIPGNYTGYAGSGAYVPGQNVPLDSAGNTYSYVCSVNPAWPFSMGPWSKINQCWFVITDYTNYTTYNLGNGSYSTYEAMGIEAKVDDGIPSSGSLLATRRSSYTTCTDVDAFSGGATAGAYIIRGTDIGDKCVLYFGFMKN